MMRKASRKAARYSSDLGTPLISPPLERRSFMKNKQNVLKLMNKNLFDIRRKELSNSVKKTVIDKDLIDSLE